MTEAMKPENIFRQISEKDLERIHKLTLLDDEFMCKYFEDNIECTELVLHIVLDTEELRVREVRT